MFKIELYLVKQIPENTDRVVSGFILTKVLLRNLESDRLKQIPENTESYTRRGTDLKGFIGVGHLLQVFLLKLNIPL